MLGREVAGLVAARAADVAVGDRVAVNPSRPCRACPFRPNSLPNPLRGGALLRQRDASPARAGRVPAGVVRDASRTGRSRLSIGSGWHPDPVPPPPRQHRAGQVRPRAPSSFPRGAGTWNAT
ncbi:hypothetical protein [Methylobacterium frigidaeris]|uniref:hypothetical protein n=1 Tax=Methylobacterium frigidaeris TaxID=2038277 RepID=UPI003F68AC0D